VEIGDLSARGEVAPLAPDLGFAPIFLFIVHCGVFQKYSDSFTQRKARGRVGCPNDLLSSSAAENLYMWGGNAQGECGIGNTANQHRPGSRTLQLLGGLNPPRGGFVTDWFCRTPKNDALKKPAVTPHRYEMHVSRFRQSNCVCIGSYLGFPHV